MKAVLYVLIPLGFLLMLGSFAGPIGFYHVDYFENDALKAPLAIVTIDGPRLTLSDGRMIELEGGPAPPGGWLAFFAEDRRIDLQDLGDGSLAVFANRRQFICGTSAPRITIPLFRERRPRNSRTIFSLARAVPSDDAPPAARAKIDHSLEAD